ncbi:MAG: nucleoside phosphorylase [Bacteroidia bacterium]
MQFKPSELILNSRGGVFHLDLIPEEISDKIILVGDPARVKTISRRFTQIEVERNHREFFSATGTIDGKRITVISTGIGTDNIDIVVNELDILASVDLEKRELLEDGQKLRLIRLGTCGILQDHIPVGAFMLSKMSIGFDALMHFYKAEESYEVYHLKDQLQNHFEDKGLTVPFYVTESKGNFVFDIPEKHQGITATLPGFYGPQGRSIKSPIKYPDFLQILNNFSSEEQKVVNFEMESSGLFGMAGILGHESACVCLGLANRITGEFLKDQNERMERLIDQVLDSI